MSGFPNGSLIFIHDCRRMWIMIGSHGYAAIDYRVTYGVPGSSSSYHGWLENLYVVMKKLRSTRIWT